MNEIDIATHIKARLQSFTIGEKLSLFYAEQLLATGIKTTSEDAFNAWSKWLASQGGKLEQALKVSDFDERVATVIREVARYN